LRSLAKQAEGLPTAGRQDRDRFSLATPFAAPASDTERHLLRIWQEILDIDGLGVNDDFFELGGESLAAVTLFAEIEAAFRKKPALSSLLKHPTIRKLASLLDGMGGQSDGSPRPEVARLVVAIRTEGRRPPLFLVHGGGGHVLFARQLLPFLDPEQPLYGIAARGLVDGESVHCNLDALVADYLAAVRQVQPKGPYYLSGYCVGSLIVFEMAQRLRAAGEPVAIVMMLDPDFNRVLTPWLYWRNPDALRIRVLRFFVSLLWQAWLLKQALLGRRQSSKAAVDSPEERRRYRAVSKSLAAVFKSYRPAPYDGKLTLFSSGERTRRLSDPVHGWPTIAANLTIIDVAQRHRDVFREALPRLGRGIEAHLQMARSEVSGRGQS
jgi:thioesterase domain-containing protein/acyl carrier protein